MTPISIEIYTCMQFLESFLFINHKDNVSNKYARVLMLFRFNIVHNMLCMARLRPEFGHVVLHEKVQLLRWTMWPTILLFIDVLDI